MKYFKGTFNWYGEVHTLHTNAPNETSAYSIFTRVLAKKLSRVPSTVRRYYKGDKDNYEIEEVKR